MKTKLEVSLPGEPDRHFPIDTRAIIGKGPTADVSLDAPGIIAQHFRVKLGVNDVDVRLAPGARPLTYEGRPFSGGPIPYGSDFYLERIRFCCTKPKEDGGGKLLPLLLLCLVLMGGAAFLLAQKDQLDAAAVSGEQDIVLFPEAPACPPSDAAASARRATGLERAAQTKRERYRYDAHDGLEAGRLYAQAGKCYQAAGDAANQQRVQQLGDGWRLKVTEDFRAARLRLRTALQDNDLNTALTAIAALQRLLAGENMPYVSSLASTERQIQVELQRIRKGADKVF